MSFSENLQFLRTRAGITQEQLAEQLEVSRQSVSKWEGAQSFPEMDTLLKICDLYDVNLDTLLRGSVEESLVADTARYDRTMTRFAKRIALSVGGLIAGVGVTGAMDGVGLPEALSGTLLLLIVTVCTVALVASGIQHNNFRKRYPVIADFYTQEEKDAFHQKFVWYIAGGVGAILFAVAMLALFFGFFPEKEPYESWAFGGFLVIIAGAVMSFIYAGITEDKYKIWKYNRENNPTPEERARRRIISAACGVIMLLAAAVYVGCGFARDMWRTAWWIFPVAGILCGAVSVALDPGTNNAEEKE